MTICCESLLEVAGEIGFHHAALEAVSDLRILREQVGERRGLQR